MSLVSLRAMCAAFGIDMDGIIERVGGPCMFGLRPVEMSGLERGSLTVDDEEWTEMLDTIRRARKDHE